MQVLADGAGTNVKSFRNLAVRQSVRHQSQHLRLPRTQASGVAGMHWGNGVLWLQRVLDGPLGRHDPPFLPRFLEHGFVEGVPRCGQVALAVVAKPGWAWRADGAAQGFGSAE